jgi:DNA repair protein RecN (Recombination protein N)
MIEQLRIQGIGVIADAQVDLGPGLTVITGETGAGKTMILSGIELLRGARAESGQLRESGEQAEVDAVVTVDEERQQLLGDVLEDLGVHIEDDALIARRTVSGNGRSRAHLSGRPVPVSALTQVWSVLVSVHGQADQARLRQAAAQRDLVDRFGGVRVREALTAYQAVWQEWKNVEQELSQLRASLSESERTSALLRLGIAEIDEVAPERGEDDALNAEAAVLEHAGGLRDAAVSARSLLSGQGEDVDTSSVISMISRAGEHLASMADVDDRLRELGVRLSHAATEIADIDAELSDYRRNLDADPARQAWVEERRSRLKALCKSYGATVEDVLQWRAEAEARVNAVDGGSQRVEELAGREELLAEQARRALQRFRADFQVERPGRKTFAQGGNPDAADFMGIDPGDENRIAAVIHRQADIAHPVGNPQTPVDFHGPRIMRIALRMVRRRLRFIDQHARHVPPGEIQSQVHTDRPAADDDNRCFDHGVTSG